MKQPGGNLRTREAEANIFACAVLMPIAWLQRDMDEKPFDIANDDEAEALAERYEVSVVTLVWWVTFLKSRKLLKSPLHSDSEE